MVRRADVFYLFVALLVFGFIADSCNDTTDASDTPKSITVIDIPKEITGIAEIIVLARLDDYSSFYGYICGLGVIENNAVTVSLLQYREGAEEEYYENIDYWEENWEEFQNEWTQPWTGSGSHYIMFKPGDYYYTKGKTMLELGLSESSSYEDFAAKMPKYNISAENSTIGFNQFGFNR